MGRGRPIRWVRVFTDVLCFRLPVGNRFLDDQDTVMADQDGDAKTIGVAPDAPAGQDDIESKPNPDGPSGTYTITGVELYNGYVQTLAGLVMIRIFRPSNSYEPILEVNAKMVKAIVEAD